MRFSVSPQAPKANQLRPKQSRGPSNSGLKLRASINPFSHSIVTLGTFVTAVETQDPNEIDPEQLMLPCGAPSNEYLYHTTAESSS